MKKLPVLLISMLAMSSAALAETPVERNRLSADGVGALRATTVASEVRADKNAVQNDKMDMHKEKRMHHKKHAKVKDSKKADANKDVKAEKVKK